MPKSAKDSTIYGLYCPEHDQGQIRYVGKTVDPKQRFYQHKSDARSGRKNNAVSKWLAKHDACQVVMKIIESEIPPGLVDERERYWIESLGTRNSEGGLNLTPGGEGGNAIAWTEDRRRATSERMKGSRNPNYKGATTHEVTAERLAAKAAATEERRIARVRLTEDEIAVIYLLGKMGMPYRVIGPAFGEDHAVVSRILDRRQTVGIILKRLEDRVGKSLDTDAILHYDVMTNSFSYEWRKS